MSIKCFDLSGNSKATQSSGEAWPEGAYCDLTRYGEKNDLTLVLWETHQGLCLYDWEANGYDDSDFYMMVWNPEKARPEPICFATTRGWSYPSYGSKPDATPEVIAAWEAYKAAEKVRSAKAKRDEQAKQLRHQHRVELALTARYGFTIKALRNLKRAEGQDRFERAVHLLASSKLRSNFKLDFQKKLAEWLKESNHQYASPFTVRQWDCV